MENNSCVGRMFVFILTVHLRVLVFTPHSELRERNVSVNVWVVNERWLFSLLWCSGVTSVTTNACHIFKDMQNPDWHLVNPKFNYSAIIFVIDTGLSVYVTPLVSFVCVLTKEA